MKSKKLFLPTDLNSCLDDQEKLATKFCPDPDQGVKATFTGKASLFIEELDWMLDRKKTHIDFMTAGNLSLHNIIEMLLQKYGRCQELWLSTWAIKEAAARSIRKVYDAGLVGRLYGIFDYRTESIDAKAFQLIRPVFSGYSLTKNHAKVVLLEWENRYITILSSANMSNNPRIETGVISLSKTTFYFHKGWMIDVQNGKKVY